MNNLRKYTFSFLILIISISNTSNVSADQKENVSPTLEYLNRVPFDQIERHYRYDFLWNDFQESTPLFNEMITREVDDPFFGYHGSTQNFRIFQDIVRAVFEEKFGFEMPADFYFFRIPGSSDFDLKNGTESFYEMFDRKDDPELLNQMVEIFILNPLKKKFGVSISTKQLTTTEQELLHQIFIDLAKHMDGSDQKGIKSLDQELINLLNYQEMTPFKMEVAQKINLAARKAGTRSLFPDHTNTTLTVLQTALLRSGQEIEEKKLYPWVKSQLSLNHILNRLYDDFYYGSISTKIDQYFFPYLDTRPSQQLRIICMNVPLYGNYFRDDESSIAIFLEDRTIEYGERFIYNELKNFFREIGIPEEDVEALFKIAEQRLRKYRSPGGVIFQFYDLSEKERYFHADHSSFVSLDFGTPLKEVSPSDLVLGQYPLKKRDIDLQLRLVMSNTTTLNPYSAFRIIRYDTLDPTDSQAIIDEMKVYLRDVKVDKKKLEQYRSKMQKIWTGNFMQS